MAPSAGQAGHGKRKKQSNPAGHVPPHQLFASLPDKGLPKCYARGIIPWKKANGQMNTVTRVVFEKDDVNCVQAFGSEWRCPDGTIVRLEPTAENVFVVEADCNMGKTYATLTYIGAALTQNPALPLVHISSRRTHGRAIDEDCRKYYPPELKMCFYLDETQKDRQRKCMTSKRLIISRGRTSPSTPTLLLT